MASIPSPGSESSASERAELPLGRSATYTPKAFHITFTALASDRWPQKQGGIMATLDPQLEPIKKQLLGAFDGGAVSLPTGQGAAFQDAGILAGTWLSAYPAAIATQPAKAFKSKDFSAPPSDTTKLADKGFWDTVWDVIEVTAPIVINAVTKDFKQPGDLKGFIDKMPANRKNDPEFKEYAVELALAVGQGTVSALSGDGTRPDMPTPPTGKDKDFWNDAWSFVQEAAPVVLPIALSLL